MSDAEYDSDDSLHEFLALSRIIPTPDANLTYDPKIAFLLQQTRKQFQLRRKQKKIVKTSIAERKRSEESCKLSYHAPSLAANTSGCNPPMHRNHRYKNLVSGTTRDEKNIVAVSSMYAKAQEVTQTGNKPSLWKATKQSHANRKRPRQAVINNSWVVNDDYILTI